MRHLRIDNLFSEQMDKEFFTISPGCEDNRLHHHRDPDCCGGCGDGVGGQGAAGTAGHPAGGHPGLCHRHLRGAKERPGAGQGLHRIQQLVNPSNICMYLS